MDKEEKIKITVVQKMEKFAEEANVSEKEIKKLIKTAREDQIETKMKALYPKLFK